MHWVETAMGNSVPSQSALDPIRLLLHARCALAVAPALTRTDAHALQAGTPDCHHWQFGCVQGGVQRRNQYALLLQDKMRFAWCSKQPALAVWCECFLQTATLRPVHSGPYLARAPKGERCLAAATSQRDPHAERFVPYVPARCGHILEQRVSFGVARVHGLPRDQHEMRCSATIIHKPRNKALQVTSGRNKKGHTWGEDAQQVISSRKRHLEVLSPSTGMQTRLPASASNGCKDHS